MLRHFDLDKVIERLSVVANISSEKATAWVLNEQWMACKAKPFQHYMTCFFCTLGSVQIYRRIGQTSKRDPRPFGWPRCGSCGGDKAWVLNPVPRALVNQMILEQNPRMTNPEAASTSQRRDALKTVRIERDCVLNEWSAIGSRRKQVNEEKEMGLTSKEQIVDKIKASDEEIERIGGVFVWEGNYFDLPKVAEDDQLL